MLAREVAQQVRGNLGRIRKRLIIKPGQVRDDLQRFSRACVEFGVIRLEVADHLARMMGLVVAFLVKSDGKRSDGNSALRLHQGSHGRGIDPAREKRAERRIRAQHLAHGALEHLF